MKAPTGCYIITIMKSDPLMKAHRQQLKNKSLVMLLLFCVSFFFHTSHAVEDNTQLFNSLEQHECHLCQQGVEPLTPSIALFYQSQARINKYLAATACAPSFDTSYILPLLRAPPLSIL